MKILSLNYWQVSVRLGYLLHECQLHSLNLPKGTLYSLHTSGVSENLHTFSQHTNSTYSFPLWDWLSPLTITELGNHSSYPHAPLLLGSILGWLYSQWMPDEGQVDRYQSCTNNVRDRAQLIWAGSYSKAQSFSSLRVNVFSKHVQQKQWSKNLWGTIWIHFSEKLQKLL